MHNLNSFLTRLRTLDHLPELNHSHTAMSSTWDRTGGNADGDDYKNIVGDRNILLDVDGPGCIHRIFTGKLGEIVQDTRIRIFLDHNPEPLFDMEVNHFFDDKQGPFLYPLVFHKTYPGMLFPIPYAKHCRVELFSAAKKWGNFWQVTYTTYANDDPVQSLRWPLNDADSSAVRAVCDAWLAAETTPPPAPASWTIEEKATIGIGESHRVKLEGCGVIRQMRVAVEPCTPQTLRNLRLRISWDQFKGFRVTNVDVPLGYLFGHGDHGNDARAHFDSLLLGVTQTEGYCCFPMPFANGAILDFVNESGQPVQNLTVRLDVERRESLPANWGRFHATWRQSRLDADALPQLRCYGRMQLPVHLVLERPTGPGKYVGVLMHVTWPLPNWWGEGDWLIWTDEEGWPPSYHGTGSEEYFNSGWCKFDRKAVSGFITQDKPGDVAVYSFHLNDSFTFQNNVRVAVEIWPAGDNLWPRPIPGASWGSTAFWYALPSQAAGSHYLLARR